MTAATIQHGSPWSASPEEDRRFIRILLATMATCIVFGLVAMQIKAPPIDLIRPDEMPPARVRLLPEISAPFSTNTASPGENTTKRSDGSRPEQQLQSSTPASPSRAAVNDIGLLALSRQLSKLHQRPTVADSAGRNLEGQVPADLRATSKPILGGAPESANTGFETQVEHQSVLGSADLPGYDIVPGSIEISGSEAGQVQSKASTPGSARSQREIQEYLNLNKGAMYSLYNRALREQSTLRGKLLLGITISPQGTVTRCEILNSELDAVQLERELVALVKGINFGPKPGSPAVTTRVPIEFFPQ